MTEACDSIQILAVVVSTAPDSDANEERLYMKTKVHQRHSCNKCGRTMEVENTSKARYTTFVLWRCRCGNQHLQKKHEPVVNIV